MKARLVNKIEENYEVTTFTLNPKVKFNFIAGQYLYLSVGHETKQFTISSAPSDPYIQITTQYHQYSDYKKKLFSIPIGGFLDIDAPHGVFTMPESEKGSHFFLSGGMGITPFRSIIRQTIQKNIDRDLTLLASFRAKRDIILENELSDLITGKKNIKIYYTISQSKEESYLYGRISIKMIKDLNQDFNNTKFWIAGPTQMVDDTEDLLLREGISEDHIVSEKLTGLSNA